MKEHDQERNQGRRRKDQVPKNKNSTQVNFYSEMMQLQVKMVVAVVVNISTLCASVHSMCVASAPQSVCGGQRTVLRNHPYPSSFMWLQGIQLQLQA